MRGNSCLLRPSPSLWEYLSSIKTWSDSISPQLLSLVNSISIVYICSMTFTSPRHSTIHVQIVTVDPVFHIHVLYLYTMYIHVSNSLCLDCFSDWKSEAVARTLRPSRCSHYSKLWGISCSPGHGGNFRCYDLQTLSGVCWK